MVSLVFSYFLQLPHTVISNSEKLTHPNVQYIQILYTVLESGSDDKGSKTVR